MNKAKCMNLPFAICIAHQPDSNRWDVAYVNEDIESVTAICGDTYIPDIVVDLNEVTKFDWYKDQLIRMFIERIERLRHE